MDIYGVVFFLVLHNGMYLINSFAKPSETEAGSAGEQPVEG